MANLRTVLFGLLLIVCCSAASFASDAYEYDYSFENPLIDAADKGNEYELTRLLKNGASPNSKGLFNSTALMRASLRGHDAVIRYLLEAGADVHAKDIGGATALHFASRSGHKKIVDLLLRYGASPDISDNEGYTPLKRAILTQHASIADALIKKGADVDTKGANGISARDLASQSRNPQMKSLIQDEVHQLAQTPLLGIPNEEIVVEPIAAAATPTALDESTTKPSRESKQSIPPKTEEADHSATKDQPQKPIIKPKSSVSVDEAIKVPHDVNLSDEATKIEVKSEKPKTAQDIQKPITQAIQQIRELSMEIGFFDNEEGAIVFWQNISDSKTLGNHHQAKLVYDNTSTTTKYKLRFDGYSSAPEVFKSCQSIRSLKADALCYVIHNIY